jgi:hypothetical protein
MWAIAVKFVLGGWNILKLIGGAIASFFRALNVQGWIGLGVALLLGYLLIHQHGETRHWHKQSDQFERLYHGEQVAHAKTVANYRAAAEKARQADAANKVRVEREQAKINERSNHAYEARIADARATADRLRRELAQAAAHPSRPGTAPVSGVSAGPAGAAQAAGQDGFSLDDRLTATEQAIQLDELIKWVKAQAAVDVNGDQKVRQ